MALPMSDPMEYGRRWALLFDEHGADLVSYAQSLGLDPFSAQSLAGRVLAHQADLEDEDSVRVRTGLILAVDCEVERVRGSRIGRPRRLASAPDPMYGGVASMGRLPRLKVRHLQRPRRWAGWPIG
jgi:hypothetical protein